MRSGLVGVRRWALVLRDIIQGPTDRDGGVYLGSNRPPSIRITTAFS